MGGNEAVDSPLIFKTFSRSLRLKRSIPVVHQRLTPCGEDGELHFAGECRADVCPNLSGVPWYCTWYCVVRGGGVGILICDESMRL